MAKILVIRFSALGDVAMTIPVIYSFAHSYPQHQVVVLSRPGMEGLFCNAPVNVQFRGADVKSVYKGLKGLSRLYRELKQEHFDAVADFHDVLRSKYLAWCFRLSGVKVATIDKGRRAKKELVSRVHKKLVQLPTSFMRYCDVLSRLGYPVSPDFFSLYNGGKGDIQSLGFKEKREERWIGVAPFAAHAGKIYPLEQMEKVVAVLAGLPGHRVFLFGGGKKEVDILSGWQERYPHVLSVAGTLKIHQELALMSWLDVMVTMDSGNMHLASLVGVPVVSVWGATHPYAGFMGWNQKVCHAVQMNMACRPCSIFGNKPCWKGDYACLYQISPETVVTQVKQVIAEIK